MAFLANFFTEDGWPVSISSCLRGIIFFDGIPHVLVSSYSINRTIYIKPRSAGLFLHYIGNRISIIKPIIP